MGLVDTKTRGYSSGIYRISFSGRHFSKMNESNYGLHLWKKIMDVGSEFGVQPYGTEALSTLRIEMGHVAGPELDGRNIPYDVGLNGMVSQKKISLVKDHYQKMLL